MIPSSIEVCVGNWNQIPGGLSLLDWLELTKGRNSVSVFVSDVWSRRKRRDKKTEEMHSYKGRISKSKQSWLRLCNTGWRPCQLLSVSYYSPVFFFLYFLSTFHPLSLLHLCFSLSFLHALSCPHFLLSFILSCSFLLSVYVYFWSKQKVKLS